MYLIITLTMLKLFNVNVFILSTGVKHKCGISFKFLLSFTAITALVVGVVVVVFGFIFKKDFEDIERKTKEIVSDIESNNA